MDSLHGGQGKKWTINQARRVGLGFKTHILNWSSQVLVGLPKQNGLHCDSPSPHHQLICMQWVSEKIINLTPQKKLWLVLIKIHLFQSIIKLKASLHLISSCDSTLQQSRLSLWLHRDYTMTIFKTTSNNTYFKEIKKVTRKACNKNDIKTKKMTTCPYSQHSCARVSTQYRQVKLQYNPPVLTCTIA